MNASASPEIARTSRPARGFVVAGVASGTGKTSVTLGILEAVIHGACAFLIAALVIVSPAVSRALTVRDMTGHEVSLAASPRRIVSLVPSVTEVLFALGSEARLVGVTDYCDFPPDARRKPSVGGMVNPNLETIVALRPDLVVATPEGNREETFNDLTRLGIPVYLVAVHRLGEVFTLVDSLGQLTERRDAAHDLVKRLEQRSEAVRRAVALRPRPRVLYVLWSDPLIVPGRNALVTELIVAAGAESVTASEGEGYPRLSLEAAVVRNPDVIVLAVHGAGTGPVDRQRWERLRTLPAVRSGRIYALDGNLLHRYGPRVVDGLEALARAIHPEAFR